MGAGTAWEDPSAQLERALVLSGALAAGADEVFETDDVRLDVLIAGILDGALSADVVSVLTALLGDLHKRWVGVDGELVGGRVWAVNIARALTMNAAAVDGVAAAVTYALDGFQADDELEEALSALGLMQVWSVLAVFCIIMSVSSADALAEQGVSCAGGDMIRWAAGLGDDPSDGGLFVVEV